MRNKGMRTTREEDKQSESERWERKNHHSGIIKGKKGKREDKGKGRGRGKGKN